MGAKTRLRIWTALFILIASPLASAAPTTAGSNLWQAAESGNVAQIKQLIASRPDLNALDLDKGWTPLIYAIKGHHPDAVQILLDAGADPAAYSGRQHFSPLALAAGEGNIDILKLLLAKGADPNVATPPAWLPLMCAAANGDCEAIKLLLDHGADPNAYNSQNFTPLRAATANGQLDAMKLLMDRGARDQDFPDALYDAAAKGQLGVLKYLLDRGVHADDNYYGHSAVTVAGIMNHPDAVRLLLDHGAPVNAPEPGEWSLAASAAANGNVKFLNEMLQRGARITDHDDNALTQTALRGHAECLQILLDHGARPEDLDELIKKTVAQGQFHTSLILFRARHRWSLTPAAARPATTKPAAAEQVKALGTPTPQDRLLIAAYENNAAEAQEVLKAAPMTDLLVLSSAKIFALQRGNIATLHIITPAVANAVKAAAEQAKLNRRLIDIAGDGDLKLMVDLLRRGADVNATDPDKIGEPLTHAVKSGRIDAVQLLLDHGALINPQYAQVTALGSVKKGDLKMARYLLARGADPNIPSYSTPLFEAVGNADLPMIQLLLDAKAHINHKANYSGDTALIYAAANGKADVVKLLLENGADLTIKNKKGSTAMDIALANGDMKIAAILRSQGAPMQPTAAMPSMDAIFNKGYDGVKQWLNHGGDPNAVISPPDTWPPVRLLGFFIDFRGVPQIQRVKILELLISRGADVKQVEGAMTSAVYAGQSVPFLQILLKHGANPNESGYNNGATPLIAAAANGTLEQVTFLLKAGARPDIRMNSGQTALDVAREANRPNIVAALRKAMAAATSEPTSRE
jgi:ankyrin repeat protein